MYTRAVFMAVITLTLSWVHILDCPRQYLSLSLRQVVIPKAQSQGPTSCLYGFSYTLERPPAHLDGYTVECNQAGTDAWTDVPGGIIEANEAAD